MAYDIYFDKVLLPVAPSKIKTEIKNKNKTIELINEGEVNLLKSAGLTQLSFTVLLPNQRYPFARYPNGFRNAAYYLGILQDYKQNKKPFQLIISRTLPRGEVLFYTTMKVSLEDYDIEDNVNEGFDTKVTINLSQYKEHGTKTVNISAYVRTTVKTTTQRPAGSGANTSGTTYTIKSGDTLWNIAKKKLGNGAKWKLIYDANKTVIENAAKSRRRASSSNGHWIYPGTKIIIPDGSSSPKNKADSSAEKPPYRIVDRNNATVRSNLSWNDAYNYYMANDGDWKGWRIVDSKNKTIEL